jgi:aspartyl-tRNA(Asn)/glutamyl-tRNA(Gln) amidotransferase subunit B
MRQRKEIAAGRVVAIQTLAWNDVTGELSVLRDKEQSGEYRYVREPDLPALLLDPAFIQSVVGALPELPLARAARIQSQYGLRPGEADVLCASRALADYFETLSALTDDTHAAAAWTMREVLTATNALQSEFTVSAARLAELILLVKAGKVTTAAARTVFRRMCETTASAWEIAQAEELSAIEARDSAEAWASEIVAAHPRELERLRNGESRIFEFFVGELMRKANGRLDPQIAREIVTSATQVG